MIVYYIFQLPISNKRKFRPVDYDEVDWRDYVCVYSFEREKEVDLEEIYEMLNINHPADYHAMSLSISDVIVKHEPQKTTVYVVDVFGFKEVKWKDT